MEDINRRKDINIAVLSGGLSNEREVSKRSGKNVHEALLRLGFNSTLIDVDKNIANVLKQGNFHYVYNTLHGKYGEDGCIQGILEILEIPYTGCGVYSSAICMNKELTKKMLSNYNIPLIKSVFVSRDENKIREKVKNLKYPLMLKPVSEGSSIGMFRVEREDEIEELFEKSKQYNQDILIEEYINGTSCTVGVLEIDNDIIATEILAFKTKTLWYDYEAKYTEGLTEFILPAKFSKKTTEKIKQIAIDCFKALNCSGVSRVDFIVGNDSNIYVLEVNTSPGMTDLSDLPAQAKTIGLDYDNLVLTILKKAGLRK